MKVLCVHPNFELYGSDRSFADSVRSFGEEFPDAEITVLLPQTGSIVSQLPSKRVSIVFRDMLILRRRQLIRRLVLNAFGNLAALWRALRDINQHDLTYINTIIGIDFILMARLSRRRAIVHVREIPNGLEMVVFRRLLIWSRASLIFNSEATRKAFALPEGQARTYVVHNGYQDPGDEPYTRLDGGRLRVLMIGRLNHWKGQETLIDALGLLPPEKRAVIDLRIVGGTFNNQDDFRDRLVEQTARLKLADVIKFEPFQDDPRSWYQWADLVVVPSRLPEPFGRVAIEAMAYGRPVIASRHGGLVEIVKEGVTGLFFPPSEARELRDAIDFFLRAPDNIPRFGAAGRERFVRMFSGQIYSEAFAGMVRTELARY